MEWDQERTSSLCRIVCKIYFFCNNHYDEGCMVVEDLQNGLQWPLTCALKSFWSVQLVDKRRENHRIWFHRGWANLWKCYAPFLETQCRYILNLLIDWWKHWMRAWISVMHYPSIKPNTWFFPFHTRVMVRWCRSCFPFPSPPRSLSQDDWVPLSTPIRGPLPNHLPRYI